MKTNQEDHTEANGHWFLAVFDTFSSLSGNGNYLAIWLLLFLLLFYTLMKFRRIVKLTNRNQIILSYISFC
jgi:hypothetical protein